MDFAEKKYVVSGKGSAGFVLMASHISSLHGAYTELDIVKIRSDVGIFGSLMVSPQHPTHQQQWQRPDGRRNGIDWLPNCQKVCHHPIIVEG